MLFPILQYHLAQARVLLCFAEFQEMKVTEVVSKWELKRLDDLNVLLQRGKNTSYGNSEIQVIKSGQARGGKLFDFSNPVFVENNFVSDDRDLKKGDILINSTGIGTAGRVTYFNLVGKYVADNHITIFRTNGKVNSEYVLYYFENYFGFKNLESAAKGISGQVELSLEDIKAIKIPVPPMDVQQKIVTECNAINNTVSEAHQRIDKAKEEVENKVKHVVDNYKNELITIGNLTETTSGGTPLSTNRAYYNNGIIPWINSGEVNQSEITATENFISELGLKNSSAKIVPANSVLIAMYGATAGKVSVFKNRSLYKSGYLCIITK